MFYRNTLKNVFDYTGAVVLMILVSPLLLIISCVLLISNNGKVLFIQQRPGKNGGIFRIYKFRTMNDKKDRDENLLPDNQRIGFVGNLLRKTSMDELPQLFNVIRGDISFIGPRPLLTDYLQLYNDHQKRRHEVKPGLTGWAQVNGRNRLSWEDKFELDVWYVDNISFSLDLKILFLTFVKILRSDDINANGSTTMERFTGTNTRMDKI